MVDIDDYVSGHEDDVEKFDFKEFKKAIYKWHGQVEDDLKKDKYDMTLLCVNAVLNTVEDYMSDCTIIESTYNTSYSNPEDDIDDYDFKRCMR